MELVDIRRVCGELYRARETGIITDSQYGVLLERVSDIKTVQSEDGDCVDDYVFQCFECGAEFILIAGTLENYRGNYCPNCGAKMDGQAQ